MSPTPEFLSEALNFFNEPPVVLYIYRERKKERKKEEK